MIPLLLMAFSATMTVGIGLIFLGVRGKQLNTHPVCRDCGFDLEGVYPGVITCPECGSGLRRPKAVRIGQRRKRRGLIVLGNAVAIVPTIGLAALAFAAVSGAELNAYKPVGLLLWEGRHGSHAVAQAAAEELVDRSVNNRFSKAQKARVVASVLDLQGDPAARWSETWGELVERARLNGELSDEQVQRWRDQAAVLEWHVRSRVRVGQPVPVALEVKETRVAASTELMAQVMVEDALRGGFFTWMASSAVNPGRRGMIPTDVPVGYLYLVGSKSRMQWFPSTSHVAFGIAPHSSVGIGRHPLTIELRITADALNTRAFVFAGGRLSRARPEQSGKAHVHSATVELLPKDAALIELIPPSPDLTRSLTNILHPAGTTHSRFMFQSRASQHFNVEGLPVPVAFDVIWKAGDREWTVGIVTSGIETPGEESAASMIIGGDGAGMRQVHCSLPGFNAKTVDVILRPSIAAAERTTDLTRIYGGELVFEDVGVSR